MTRDGLQAASSLELVSRDELEALLDQLDRGVTLDAEFLATHLLLDLTNAERLLTLCQESSCQTLSETDSDSQPPGSALLTTKIGEEQFQHFLSELRQARNLTKKVTPPHGLSNLPEEFDDSADSFPRFREIQEIDRGGMGSILSVHDPNANRSIAVKTLLPERSHDARAVRRFLREARLTAGLEHPNIVPVHEVGFSPQRGLYFSMKKVEGKSLAAILAQERQREGPREYTTLKALRDLLKVCEALSLAHDRGVVHRDLKPANIMIGQFGEVLVMDWGLAKTDWSEEASSETITPPEVDPLHTADGVVLGTLLYMPPEQALGEIDLIDARSDIYSLGAILYEVLTLHRAHLGRKQPQLIALIAQGAAKVALGSEFARNLPHELAAVISKAMSVDQRNRYQTVGELQADLEAYLEGLPLLAARYNLFQKMSKWVSRHRVVSSTIAATLLCSSLLLGWSRWQENSQRHTRITNAIAAARLLLGSHPDATALRTKWWGGSSSSEDRGESPAQRIEREHSLSAYLDAVANLDRALRLDPNHPEARRLRLEVGEELGHLALLGRDDSLARRAFRDLEDHGASIEQVASLDRLVEETRNALLHRRRERLNAILADLTAGLARPDRPADAPIFEELVDEALSFQDEQTVTLLGKALDEMTERALQTTKSETTQNWSLLDHERSRFLCQVLGRLRFPGAVPPLGRWITAVRDHRLTVEAGKALCRTRQSSALPYLDQTWKRVHSNSPTWRQIRRDLWLLAGASSLKKPVNADDYFNRALLRSERGDIEGALKDYDRTIQLNPRYTNAYLNRCHLLFKSGKTDLALQDLDLALQLAPENENLYLTRGTIHNRLGHYSRALEDYQKAIELKNRFPEAYMNRGNTYRQLKRLREALENYDQAIVLRPEYAKAYNNRGECLTQMKRFEEAIRDFSLSISIDSEAFWPYFQRARIHHQQKTLDKAIEDYDRTIHRAPDHHDAYYFRASAHFDRKDFENAGRDWGLAIELRPDQWDSYYNRGICRERLGNAKEALEDYEASLRLAPSYSRVLERLLTLLEKLDRKPEAVRRLKTFLLKNPDHPQGRALEQRLTELSRE